MKRSVLSAFAVLCSLVLASCSEPKATAGVPVLRVADQLHALQSVLSAAGEDQPQGYRIAWSNFLGGPNIIAAQTGGSIDLGSMSETPLVFAQAAGSPVKMVAASRGTRPGASNIALVVPANSPIRTPADLRGKAVAFLPGTVTQYLVANVLKEHGLSLSDVRAVRLANLGASILERGIADAITVGEPTLSQGLAAGKFRVLAHGGEPNTPGFNYLVASEAALQDPVRVKAMADFAVRVARATKWQRENVAKAAPVTAKAYNVSVQTAEQILRRTPLRYTPIDGSVVAAHQREADLFYQLGLIRTRVVAAALFDDRFNALIAPVESTR